MTGTFVVEKAVKRSKCSLCVDFVLKEQLKVSTYCGRSNAHAHLSCLQEYIKTRELEIEQKVQATKELIEKSNFGLVE